MTEANDDGNNLVRVRAQVMMRDDSTGGWVPMGGGGLSNVCVKKRLALDDPKHEYLIYGKRIWDQTVVLSCTIKKDFEYNKVMPTFHHWKTGDKKFGLTFQTAADARAFDKGVRMAVEDLLDGLNDFPYRHGMDIEVGDDNVFMAVNLPVDREGSKSSSGSSNTCSSSRHTPATTPLPTPDHPPYHHHHPHHHTHCSPVGGGVGGIITAGGTGIPTTNNSPTSTTSKLATSTVGVTAQPYTHPHANDHHLYRITFPPRPRLTLPHNHHPPDKTLGPDCDLKSGGPPDMPSDQDKIEAIGKDTYAYVEFNRDQQPVLQHEYSYPMVEGIKGEKRDSIASIKKQQQLELVGGTHPQPMPHPLLPGNGKRPRKRVRKTIKARCRHCQEMFTYDTNSRGSCEYSPDCVRTAIDTITCISCAQCMLYHCMSDAEGDFAHHPCECGGPGGTADESCGRRWLGLTLLSLLVPCLWCYVPLRACHRCAVACGLCGGRHEAS
ncbi:Spred2p [Halocaridina rubra]|uniref:Spred2p n=1 Tax=Halocaridina rubra TaxID=373956 RepID=A0AAN8ZV38_HALRR